MRNRRLIASFCGLLAAGLLMLCLLPQRAVSLAERRMLRTFPPPTIGSVFSGDWAKRFEAYLPDQFPLREPLRRLALCIRTDVLRQLDYEGAYVAEGRIVRMEYPLNERAVKQHASRIDALSQRHFSLAKVYLSLVPDKGAYLARESGRLSLDFAEMENLLFQGVPHAQGISLRSALTAADYYDTDMHWRQERLQGAVDALGDAMGFAPPDLAAMEQTAYAPFYGTDYHKASGVSPDTLITLSNKKTDVAWVENLQKPAVTRVYDAEAFAGIDGYDVFLSGATPLVTITDPAPGKLAKGRRLILMRDSFGSSLAPLLISAYESITLVDLRYLSPSLLEAYLPPIDEKTDVLFLYGVQVVNGAGALS